MIKRLGRAAQAFICAVLVFNTAFSSAAMAAEEGENASFGEFLELEEDTSLEAPDKEEIIEIPGDYSSSEDSSEEDCPETSKSIYFHL